MSDASFLAIIKRIEFSDGLVSSEKFVLFSQAAAVVLSVWQRMQSSGLMLP
jgi:hypothetical protein